MRIDKLILRAIINTLAAIAAVLLTLYYKKEKGL